MGRKEQWGSGRNEDKRSMREEGMGTRSTYGIKGLLQGILTEREGTQGTYEGVVG